MMAVWVTHIRSPVKNSSDKLNLSRKVLMSGYDHRQFSSLFFGKFNIGQTTHVFNNDNNCGGLIYFRI